MKSNRLLAWILALSHTLYPEALGAFEVGESSKSTKDLPKFNSKNVNQESPLQEHRAIDIPLQYSPPRETTQSSKQKISKIPKTLRRPRTPTIQLGKPEGTLSNIRSKIASWREQIPTLEEFTGKFHSILGTSGSEEIDPFENLPPFDPNQLQILEKWVNHVYNEENTKLWLLGELNGASQRSIVYKYNTKLIRLGENFELGRYNQLSNPIQDVSVVYFKRVKDYVAMILKDVAKLKGETDVELARIADCAFALAQVTVQNTKVIGLQEVVLRQEIQSLILNLWKNDEYIPNLSNRRVNSLFQTFSKMLDP